MLVGVPKDAPTRLEPIRIRYTRLTRRLISMNGNYCLTSMPALTADQDLRVAQFPPDIGWTFRYTFNTNFMKTPTTTGSGSVTQATGMANLQTGATQNSSAMMETRKYLRYIPGMGIRVFFNAIFTSGVTGSSQIIGLGNYNDGVFFGYDGANFGVMRRDATTDTWIHQANWNMDKCDGTGNSKFNLDPTKGNIYVITYQGGGFGLVTFLIINPQSGDAIPVHKIVRGNLATEPVITTPNLPLMAEVKNPSTQTNITLRTASGTAGIEGIPDKAIVTRNSFSNSLTVSSNTETNILTIKNRDTYGSIINRTPIRILMLSLATDSGTSTIEFRLRRNVTLTGSTSFTDIDSNNSAISFNTAGTYSSGTGTRVFTTQLARSGSEVIDMLPLDMPLSPGETLTVTALTSGNNAVCSASINWMEFY